MLEFNFKDFAFTVDAVLKQAKKDDKEIVYENGKKALSSVAKFTPKNKGFARAGWLAAWSALGLTGAPYTTQKFGRTYIKNGGAVVAYIVDGDFIDNTNDPENPHIIFTNKVAVLTAAGSQREAFKRRRAKGERISKEEREAVKGQRSKISYLYLIEKGKLTDENGKPAGQDHQGFFTTTMKTQKFYFDKFYDRNFQRHSAK